MENAESLERIGTSDSLILRQLATWDFTQRNLAQGGFLSSHWLWDFLKTLKPHWYLFWGWKLKDFTIDMQLVTAMSPLWTKDTFGNTFLENFHKNLRELISKIIAENMWVFNFLIQSN